jgi:hypothetical protein
MAESVVRAATEVRVAAVRSRRAPGRRATGATASLESWPGTYGDNGSGGDDGSGQGGAIYSTGIWSYQV